MDVSIIIVNYNTEKLILDCLDSIYEKTKEIEFEIIVVDNNSPQKPKFLKKDKRIQYIQSDTNLGFGRANNLGAEYAKGEFIFCLNPDTILVNNAIKILHNYICKNLSIGICGGNLLSNDMKHIHSFCMIPPGIWNEIISLFKLGRLYPQYNLSQKVIDVEYITGADLMINRNLFNKIDGFDKDFFMYYEETFLCHEVKSLGYRIVNVPQALIIHLEGKSFNLNKHKEMLLYSGRKLYLIKRYNKYYYSVCNFIHFITCMSRLLIFANNKEKRHLWSYKLKLLFSS